MNVVVTGGAGFIGSFLTKYLVDRNYNIVIIDDLSTGNINNIKELLNKVVFINENILNIDRIRGFFEDASIVVHLAAVPSVEESIRDPALVYKINTIGTLNLLELSRRYNIEKFIYISSAAVYGNPVYTPIDEKHPCNPINIYGVSKYSSELLVTNYYRNYGLKYNILRLFNVYGPRMRDGVIYYFIKNTLLNREVYIYGNGEQTRDFIYVEDVVEAIHNAMNSSKNDVYNIGSGTCVSINQLLNIVSRILNKSIKPLYKSERIGDIKHSVADISKAVLELNWRPRTSLEKGLEKTIEYFKQITLENS